MGLNSLASPHPCITTLDHQLFESTGLPWMPPGATVLKEMT